MIYVCANCEYRNADLREFHILWDGGTGVSYCSSCIDEARDALNQEEPEDDR